MAMDEDAAEVQLYLAVLHEDLDELTRLLDAHPHLKDAPDPHEGLLTPLIMAAVEGSAGVVRLLLERRAEVDASTPTGRTALHGAAVSGDQEVVSMLLSSGADSSRKDRDGCSVLMHACHFGRLGMVQQLLQHMRGQGLNETDLIGDTALCYACKKGHVEIVRALLLAGADHTIAGPHRHTPRRQAEDKRHTECVALLEVSHTCEGGREGCKSLLGR
jgi:ankyrin repeat protein